MKIISILLTVLLFSTFVFASLPAESQKWLDQNSKTITKLYISGGTQVVDDATVTAQPVAAKPPTLSDRLNAKVLELNGKTIPADYDLITENGNYVLKVVSLNTVPDAVINALADTESKTTLVYTIEVKDRVIVSARAGSTTDYKMLFGVTNDAATRILDASDTLGQVKIEMQNSKLRYKAFGFLDTKLQFVKSLSGFLGVLAPQLKDSLKFLDGLK